MELAEIYSEQDGGNCGRSPSTPMAPATLGVYYCDGGKIYDVLYLIAALNHVHRAGHAYQDWTHDIRIGQPLDKLVGDVSGLQAGENEYIRFFA